MDTIYERRDINTRDNDKGKSPLEKIVDKGSKEIWAKDYAIDSVLKEVARKAYNLGYNDAQSERRKTSGQNKNTDVEQ